MLVGIRQLKEGKISAFISCANTGALLAVTRTTLDTFQGITRPALACTIPAHNGDVIMLDVGGNVDSSVDMLLQFALLGASYSHAFMKVARPKVALLNIGEEASKGTQELKDALSALKLAESEYFEFIGNKEPYDVFTRQADVFVTNGFNGNLFVKTSEAASRHILGCLLQKYPDIELKGLISEGSGAMVLGVKELVIKCHGASSIQAIQQALMHTKELIKQKAITQMQAFIAQITN